MPIIEHYIHLGYGESGRRDAAYYPPDDWTRTIHGHPETYEVGHAHGADLVRHRERLGEVYRYDHETTITFGPVVVCQPITDQILIREAFGACA